MKHLKTVSRVPQHASLDIQSIINILTFIIQILTAFETLFSTKETTNGTK